MAKTDNLSDFLTDVANSIRTKTGTTEQINAQDFSNNILSIQSESTLKKLLDTKVHLDLWVKVKKDWKDRPDDLRALGYSLDNFQ